MAGQPGWEEVLLLSQMHPWWLQPAQTLEQHPAARSQPLGPRRGEPGSIGSIAGVEPGSAPSVGLPLPQDQISHTCEACDK